jgi:hypothetical protein
LPTKPTVYVALPLATGNNPCCSIRGDVIHDQQIPLIKEVAAAKHVPVIDLNTDTTGHPEYFGDGVHPNDAGYLVMANLVKKGLEREPTVSITSPLATDTPAAGMVPITAMAAAGTVDISSVELFDGTTSLGKVTASPFTFNWQATAGAHLLTAKATDSTLANATSPAVTITVKDAAPSGGSGGAGGNGGNSGAGAAAPGGSASMTAGTASSPGGASGSGSVAGNTSVAGGAGSGTATPPSSASDDGSCSVQAAGSFRSKIGLSVLLLAGALGAARRRSSRRRA